MNIFKKNGELNLSNLSEYVGFNSQKLKSDLIKIKNSLTNKDKEKNQRQYDALVLGGLAMYAGLTKEEVIKMIKKPTVVIMIGLPCSGKSTYIKENLKDFKVVSFDKYILEYFETDNYNLAQERYMKLSQEQKDIISVHNKIYYRELLLKGEDIVIDYTNLTKDWLHRWLDIVPPNYKKLGVVFKTDFETILDRNNRKDKFIPISVLENMKEVFEEEEIDYTEYFDSVLIFE